MKILLTGGTGSFGQAFTERLLQDGLASRICIYSRGEHDQAHMAKRFKNDPRLRFFIGDVRDRWRLTRAMEGCDTVVHAAALKRIEVGYYNPQEMVRTNIEGAINVTEAARDSGVAKVVALSTDKAFQPVSPYGQSKALAEALFIAADGPNTHFAVCRYGNVWKSQGSIVPTWQQIIEDGEDAVPVTDPDATRFFMHMHEAIDLVLETLRDMPGGEIRIPSLPAYRVGDLAEAMRVKTIVVGMPAWEKKHESLDELNCSADARRMSVEELRAEL